MPPSHSVHPRARAGRMSSSHAGATSMLRSVTCSSSSPANTRSTSSARARTARTKPAFTKSSGAAEGRRQHDELQRCARTRCARAAMMRARQARSARASRRREQGDRRRRTAAPASAPGATVSPDPRAPARSRRRARRRPVTVARFATRSEASVSAGSRCGLLAAAIEEQRVVRAHRDDQQHPDDVQDA